MISIREVTNHRLAWYRSELDSDMFELRPEGMTGQMVAVFRDRGRIKVPGGTKRNFFWSLLEAFDFETLYLADAETAEGHWQFLRRQSSTPTVTVRLPGDPPSIAEFKGDVLELPQGRWRLRSMRWAWHDPDDRLVVRWRPKSWGFWSSRGRRGYVEFAPAAEHCAELPLLVLLGWYEYLRWQDSGD